MAALLYYIGNESIGGLRMRYVFGLLLILCIASCALGEVSPWTASWIWNPTPQKDVWFRKVVTAKSAVSQAKITATADNVFELYINGKKVGSDSDWTSIEVYDITKLVKKGPNVIAVKATDTGSDLGALIVEGAFTYPDGDTTIFGTDKTWKMSLAEKRGWTSAGFNDSSWKAPKEIGKPPVGPWGGIVLPDLVQKSSMQVLAVSWPKSVEPGDTFGVVCEVKLLKKVSVKTSVGLRIYLGNEPVCEQWMESAKPVNTWKPGVVETVTFKDFRLPSYVPTGKMRAQVITTATNSVGAFDIVIGPLTEKPAVPLVTISNLSVKPIGTGEYVGTPQLDVSANVKGAKDGFMFALFRGKTMYFAAKMSSASGRVDIPKDFPGGVYDAMLLPHQASCPNPPSVRVTVNNEANNSWMPLGYGTYKDYNALPHRWYINHAGTLVWDGEPYVFGGAMYLSNFLMSYKLGSIENNEAAFKDDITRLTAMKVAGISDIYLNPCVGWNKKPYWVWNRFCELCESMGVSYGIQVTRDEEEMLRYFDVTNEEYTVSVKGGENASLIVNSWLTYNVNSKNRALFAAFSAKTGEALDWGKAAVIDVPNGVRLEAKPKVKAGEKVVVHFVPELNYDAGFHDYWTYVDDKFKAEWGEFFAGLKPGPGLRNWLDPLDNEQGLGDFKARKLPQSPAFRKMYAGYLKEKYGTVNALVQAWAIKDAKGASFAELARLVPVGKASAERTDEYALDEVSGHIYRYTPVQSAMWSDMLYYRDNSAGAFNMDIAEMIKKYHDVPVVLKHEGSDLYKNRRSFGGFDGLGAEAYGTSVEHLQECSTSVHKQALGCAHTMWELTTETGLAAAYMSYPNPLRMIRDYAAMVEVGGKGTYNFLIKDAHGNPNGDWYTFNLYEDPRQLYWLGAYNRIVKSASKLPDYTPESLGSKDFYRDVLDLKILDMGSTFEAIHFGTTTYVWNMTDYPNKLTLNVPAGAGKVEIENGDGRKLAVSVAGKIELVIPAHAERPAIIDGLRDAKIEGVDEANMYAAVQAWNKAKEKASELGAEVSPLSPSLNWQEVAAKADELRKSAGDMFARWLPKVNVDGDLSEWSTVKPMYVKNSWDVDASKYEGAEFYVGYDDNYIYIAGSVSDDNIANNYKLGKLWNGDAVEVFLDLNPDANPGNPAYTADCYQFIFSPTSVDKKPAMTVMGPAFAPDSVPQSSLISVKKREAGWQFEAAISKQDLKGYNFKSGKVVGFNLQIDQGDGGDRVGSRIWRGALEVFKDRLMFGKLAFEKAK